MAIFEDAYTAILLGQPFFGQLLTKLKIVAEPNAQVIDTLAVSHDTLFWHPPYFEALTDDEGIAAITHEVIHAMYAHVVDMGMYHETMIGPDGKPYDQEKYNEACDYVVNDLLKVNKIGALKPTWYWDAAYPHTMTPQEIYCALPKSKGNGPRKNKQGQIGQDKHQPAPSGAQGGITPADVFSAYENSKAMGNTPAGIDRLVKEIKRPAQSPWAQLRQAVFEALTGTERSTWRRLNRQMLTRGVIMPGRTGYASKRVGVVVDVSGSIGDEMVALFFGHLGAIINDMRPKETKLYWTDADVHRVDTAKTGHDLKKISEKPVPGGGGTDMTKGIKAAVGDKCDTVIVLTDGYTPFGLPPKGRPVIWAMTTTVEAPYGRTIKIC